MYHACACMCVPKLAEERLVSCCRCVCVSVGRLLSVCLCCSAVVSMSVCRDWSAVRSFVLCGPRSSLLGTPVLRPCSGSVRLPRERKGIGRCVQCVLATCRVKEGLSRSEQLWGISI